MASGFIGKTISLISNADIRYRGVLHSIDQAAATISLEKVRSLGTEGRKANPAEELPGNDNVYEFIVFRAGDVKHLTVDETAPPPPPPSVPQDPAIVNSGPFSGGPPPQGLYGPPGQQFPPGGPGPYGYGPPPGAFGGYGPGPYSPFGPPPQQNSFPGRPGPSFPPPLQQQQQQQQQPAQPPSVSVPSTTATSKPAVSPIGPPSKSTAAAQPAPQQQQPSPTPATKPHPVASAPKAAAPAPASQPAAPKPAAAAPPQQRPAPVPQPSLPAKPTSFAQAASRPTTTTTSEPSKIDSAPTQSIEEALGDLNVNGTGVNGAAGTRRGVRGGQNRASAATRQPQQPVPAQVPQTPSKPPTVNGLRGEFDMQEANARFTKPNEAEVPTSASSDKLYDKKSSFFDNISSDLKARGDAGNNRFDRQKERAQNMAAFGEDGASLNQGYNGAPRRRGGGRGGRGGYRGGPRQ